ncbi:hypothetical protein [Agromyces sp. LHK192]|uniref:hypothetical protein n=1 Tax=Agromyces sp. LHK192 TaxID=2498704 RepID=UPI000FDB8B8A|nr:hypothetical protein [Agromyces sp. LHK192]
MSAPDPTTSHDELRAGLHRAADGAAPASIDVDAVLARSRSARRRRRTALVGTAASVAGLVVVAGIVAGLVANGPQLATGSMVASEDAATDDGGDAGQLGTAPTEGAVGVAPADQAPTSDDRVVLDGPFTCGEPAPQSTTATDAPGGGLVATVDAAGVEVVPGDPSRVAGTAIVSLTNAGEKTLSGRLTPRVAVGVVDGAGRLAEEEFRILTRADGTVRLGPGESLIVEVPVEPRRCADTGAGSDAGDRAGGDRARSLIVGLSVDVDGRDAPLVVVAPAVPLGIG